MIVLQHKDPTPWVYSSEDGLMHSTKITRLRVDHSSNVKDLFEALGQISDMDAKVHLSETGIRITSTLLRTQSIEEKQARLAEELEAARKQAALQDARDRARPLLAEAIQRSQRTRADDLRDELRAIEAAGMMVLREMDEETSLDRIRDLLADAKTLCVRATEVKLELQTCNRAPSSS